MLYIFISRLPLPIPRHTLFLIAYLLPVRTIPQSSLTPSFKSSPIRCSCSCPRQSLQRDIWLVHSATIYSTALSVDLFKMVHNHPVRTMPYRLTYESSPHARIRPIYMADSSPHIVVVWKVVFSNFFFHVHSQKSLKKKLILPLPKFWFDTPYL